MTLTRDEIIAIIEREVVCNNRCDCIEAALCGAEDAADAIMARLESPFGKYGDPAISDDCELCYGDGDCPSEMDRWMCTRELGHSGDHVACGGAGSHLARTWHNAQDDL